MRYRSGTLRRVRREMVFYGIEWARAFLPERGVRGVEH
jgi:hypothetical protein